ncbi:hypothetical protein ACFODL_14690 [Phenylobacterium terrae]|uniref:Lysozyme inhibitor LprI N-terminal domain-containing protein n=1 Tax=Phenylobacterium terrae TaxID=2665495 RepID=A0ABW4N190_9CAUL
MADQPRDFIPKDNPEGDRMLVFELASKDRPSAGPPPPPPQAEEPLPLSREPRRKGSRKTLWLGVAGAVALGAVLGVVARPELVGEPQKMQAARPPAEAPAITVPQMQVMVRDEPEGEATPPPASPPAEPSDSQLAAVPAPPAPAAPAAEPPAPRLGPPAQVAIAPARPATPPRAESPPPEPRLATRTEPEPPRVRPSFDCRYAGSLSEEMVCSDPQLAAADRRLARAYERAVAAGVPRRYLRAEQDDWLAIREQAARRSPGAVADIYEQRTAELNDMAIEAQEGF